MPPYPRALPILVARDSGRSVALGQPGLASPFAQQLQRPGASLANNPPGLPTSYHIFTSEPERSATSRRRCEPLNEQRLLRQILRLHRKRSSARLASLCLPYSPSLVEVQLLPCRSLSDTFQMRYCCISMGSCRTEIDPMGITKATNPRLERRHVACAFLQLGNSWEH
jgi:hypothetical protein